MLKILKSKRGASFVETVVLTFAFILALAVIVRVMPVFLAKYELTHYANELVREAEISGSTGTSVQQRKALLEDKLKLTPDTMAWDGTDFIDGTNKIHLGDEIHLRVTKEMDIGLFTIGSFKVNLVSAASGKSEVYWK